jgi:hypothetical protein
MDRLENEFIYVVHIISKVKGKLQRGIKSKIITSLKTTVLLITQM